MSMGRGGSITRHLKEFQNSENALRRGCFKVRAFAAWFTILSNLKCGFEKHPLSGNFGKTI
jgi:hypothetical protein